MMYTPDNAPGRRAEASSQLRVIVLGYIVRGPLGGLAWHHLQYVMGLRLLGYDVYFVEDSNDYPACYDPVRNVTDENPDFGLKFAARTFARVGLADRWAYYDAHTSQWLGPGADSILDVCSTADLLLDLSPMDPLRPWLMEIPARALIDTDPGFRQVRHLKDPEARSLALQHTGFFSFGENCASGDCSTPDDGLHWRPTRQPIVLDAWPVKPGPAHGKFTTVMQWDSYPAIEHNGRRYGMKSDSFAPYMDLPARAGPIFELAVGSATAPRAAPEKGMAGAGFAGTDARSVDVSKLHSAVQGRVCRGQARLHRLPLRLVQRAKRGLSRQRPTGAGTGNRLLGLVALGTRRPVLQ